MTVENPVPAITALLALALPGVVALGWSLSWVATHDRRMSRYLTPAVATAVWILSLHVSGKAIGSFHTALWVGTLLLAALGIVLYTRLRPVSQRYPGVSDPPSRWMWAGAIATAAIISAIALRWAFHDEIIFSGHMSIAAAIQNGPYPPRSISIPAFELRYHYAFPLLVAAFTSITRMPVPMGIDSITIASSGYLFVLLWLLGERILGKGRGWLTALLVLFGSGVPFVCAGGTEGLASSLLGYCAIDGMSLNPPIISYFFQHPWTLGLPIAIALMLLAVDQRSSPLRVLLMGVLLVALSFSQIALFAAMSASLVASETFARGFSMRRGILMFAVSAFAWLAAVRLGGFFAPAPDGSLSLTLTPGIVDGLIATVAWNAATFGLLIPFGIIGLARAGSLRVLLTCLALGGLVIINFIRYTHSWDIVKFGAVAAVGLSIAASAAIAHIINMEPRRMARSIAGVAMACLMAGGLAFASAFVFDIEGIPEDTFHRRPAGYSVDEAHAMNWLRTHARPGEVVYRNSGDAMSFSQWAGLPQPWYDPMLETFGGAPASQNERRELLIETMPEDPAAYRAENIVWFVIRRDDSRAARITDRWVAERIAHERAIFGSLRVIELPRIANDAGTSGPITGRDAAIGTR